MNKEIREEEIVVAETTEDSTTFTEPIDFTTYQSVIVILSDGSQHIFSGPVVVYPGDSRSIKQIKFTLPKKLAKGYAFEKMEESVKEGE